MSDWDLDKKQVEFSQLKGKTLTEIIGGEAGSDRITFICNDGSEYVMYHSQDCCESVSVEDIVGDIADLIGNPILTAEERTSDQNPAGINKKYQDSFTWTFYELATIKGSVTLRWYGESNGYYSESVYFAKTK